MKYSPGYQIMEDDKFIDTIIRLKDHIDEVYFSWGDFANGRNKQTCQRYFTEWEAIDKQCADLDRLSKAGIKFNLLFNGNCYGKDSLSSTFFNKIGDTIDYLQSKYQISSVTTTSPVIAKFIKANFEEIVVRASVNMEIGTIQGMDYLFENFDAFYLKREYNRNFNVIRKLKKWCDDNGKGLCILANSGCLNYCSAHNFHDNLVSHESEISQMKNAYTFDGICHTYLKNEAKQFSLIRDTNFIRPEDIKLYEPYFSSVKLATRVNSNPVQVLYSYVNERFYGNILDLLEPNHSSVISPCMIDNTKLNNSYLYCDKNCENCNKCKENYENALIKMEENRYADKQND